MHVFSIYLNSTIVVTLARVKMDKKSIKLLKYPLFLIEVEKIKLQTKSSVSWRFDDKLPEK